MKVEIWADIGCPFCYIGKRRFESALERFVFRDKVKVEHRSFQVDPHAEKKPSYNVYDLLVAKTGYSKEKVRDMNKQVDQQAKAVGLDFQFDRIIPANSLDAHRLIKFAEHYGKSAEVMELLFKVYFTDAKHIGNTDTLADVAAEAGMDREQAIRMLEGTEYTDEVRADGREARSFGASGVPFYVINRKYAISGAQPSEVFFEALQKAWNEEHPLITIDSALNQVSDHVCEEGLCTPKDFLTNRE